MKRYRQVTAIVLVLILILGTAVYAYPVPEDVEGTGHEEAMTTLAALGILKGRDTGEFDPAGSITRAEFAAVVIRALGLESSVQAAEYDPVDYFDDCGDNAWAWGYINLAFKQGIIEGYGERMFGPNDPVTYEQAVAMLVRILGYDYYAQKEGGWTVGYTTVANEIKLTEGIENTGSQPAARGIVAQLTFRALEVPICESSCFGDLDPENPYIITDKTLLKDKLDIDKKFIQIISTDQAAVEGENNKAREFSYREEKTDGSYSKIQTAKTEDPDTASYLGYSAKGYFKYDKLTNEYTAILLWPEEKNRTITVDASQIGEISTKEFQYIENGITQKLNIAGSAVVINGSRKTELSPSDLKPKKGTVTLIDNNGDSVYEVILVKTQTFQYAYVINSSISGTDSKSASLTLYTEKGEKITAACNSFLELNGERAAAISNGECVIPSNSMIEYRLDGDGKIVAANLPFNNTGTSSSNDNFSMDYKNEDAQYDNSSTINNKFIITSDTVIFVIPADESGSPITDEIKIGTKNDLKGQSTVNVTLYNVNLNHEISLLVYQPPTVEESYSPVSIVAAERVADTKNSDGSTVQRVYGMKDGKQVQLLTKNDTILADKYSMEQIQQEVTKKTGLTPGSSETNNGATYEQWVMSYRAAYQYIPGSILLYTTNGYDEIRYAYKIFPANHPDYIQWDNGKSSIKPYVLLDDNFGMASEDRRRIITGTAANKVNDGILTFDAARVSGDFPMRVALSEFANVYTIDTGTGEAIIQNGSISQISKGDTVVVHEYDDEVKDIFIYRNFDLNRILK